MAAKDAGPKSIEQEMLADRMAAAGKNENQVLTLEEISNLAAEGGKPAETLMNVVALIANRFKTDVCSAYLLEPDRRELNPGRNFGVTPAMRGDIAHGIE